MDSTEIGQVASSSGDRHAETGRWHKASGQKSPRIPRWVQGAGGTAAIVAALTAAVPAVSATLGHAATAPGPGASQAARRPVAYVLNGPSRAAINPADRPIPVGREPQPIAITPNGMPGYVLNYPWGMVTPNYPWGMVTPIAIAT